MHIIIYASATQTQLQELENNILYSKNKMIYTMCGPNASRMMHNANFQMREKQWYSSGTLYVSFWSYCTINVFNNTIY